MHKFWTYFSQWHKQARKFTWCLKKRGLGRASCYGITREYCGRRFAQKPPERMEQCRRVLADEINVNTSGLGQNVVRMFNNYTSCFQSYRQRVDANCTDLLRKAIADHRLRATKVVRATMNSMRPLLRALPDLRVIQLVRDPRAVTLSRYRFSGSGRGAYTERVRKKQSPFVAEATLYCHHATADIRSRLALEREFPGRVMLMRYEDVIANPEQRFRDIYKLLDEPIPKSTLQQMENKASRGQRRNLTTKWQKVLTLTDQAEIARRCSEFFRLIGVSPGEIPAISTTPTYKRGKSLKPRPTPAVSRVA